MRRFVRVLQITKWRQNRRCTPTYAYIDLMALRFGVSFFQVDMQKKIELKLSPNC